MGKKALLIAMVTVVIDTKDWRHLPTVGKPEGLFAQYAPFNRVLLIGSDISIAQMIVAAFQRAGASVDWLLCAKSALERHAMGGINLVILDADVGIDGLQVCQRIRDADRITPILMLAAQATNADVVRGLESGADGYLAKPCCIQEVVARSEAMLRRAPLINIEKWLDPSSKSIRRGPLLLDEVKREILIDERVISLTATEFDLLLLLAKHPGRVFTRDELLTRVWGPGFEAYEHTVNVHINPLRRKVEKDARHPVLIETLWSVGYRFAASLA